MTSCDILIVGGGIAGASLAAEIAGQARVLLIDAESQCGYHSTGRSAAFWLESYGGPLVAPLTRASHAELMGGGFLTPRGALHISRDGLADVPESVDVSPIGRPELERLVPGIRPEWTRALLEPGCADIDVAGLHAGYLAAVRRAAEIRNDARLVSARRSAGAWIVDLEDECRIEAEIIVDAAGAWADDVARRCGVAALGIVPKRRTMVQLRVGQSGLKDMPLVSDAEGTFYFKGEGDRTVWLSPHDEIDTDPCDAAPEEIDVATAIDRFEQVVDWPIEAVERRWAGLRSFAPDRVPVYGFDPDEPSFFWCAGQGGFGIQTAPAAARLAASLLLGTALDPSVAQIDAADFSPARFRNARAT